MYEPISPPPEAPRFLSVAEAASILGVSEVTIYREISSGDFPAVKIRGRYVVPAKALDLLEAAALSRRSRDDSADYSREGSGGGPAVTPAATSTTSDALVMGWRANRRADRSDTRRGVR